MSNFWDMVWLMISTFFFVAYLIIMFQIVIDLFRDHELGGGSKVLWVIGLIFIPVLTAIIYIIARGKGMAQRQGVIQPRRHAFRPPRGEMGWRMLWHCIRRRVPVAYWSYDSLDYARGDADALLATARRYPPRPGDVILMHDDGPLSLAYLQAMLPAWRAEGYRFETLPVHG